MESAPPTYEAATRVDIWALVANYVPTNDLCTAVLVCSRWHITFAPHLWGNPASHFGIENDRVYVALTKFKRTLLTARLLVRSMTHTLHLPPAHAELYNGPHADWLRDILERLPHLQSLMVRGLPFFDHASLQALKYCKPKQQDRRPVSGVVELPGSSGYAFDASSQVALPTFNLRLLDASRCPNVTGNALSQGLSKFETLLYLDLSFTYPARDTVVLSGLRHLSGLQVLKLRGVSLTDAALETLAEAIGQRVRSLDIRDNHITDRGVRTLLDHCFAKGDPLPNGARSPALLPYLGQEMLAIYQGEDFEGYLRTAFTDSFVSRFAIEDVPEGGITHLYVAGNALTAEGASGLIRSGRLHVIDLGEVISGRVKHSYSTNQDTELDMPGVEKLLPVLWKDASESLSFLRIDHAIVTKASPELHPEEIVQGRVEMSDTSMAAMNGAQELDVTPTQQELSELPTESSPRYELAGDPMHFVVSPPINDSPHLDDDTADSSARRGSAFAPEVIKGLSAQTQDLVLLSPASVLDDERTSSASISDTSATSHSATIDSTCQAPAKRRRTYSSVAVQRHSRLLAHMTRTRNLHPAMLPHVVSLILTDVPMQSHSPDEADRIITFIKQCAEEAAMAKEQAKLDYALPPGRRGHASALKHSANKVFALRRLVLEMAPEVNHQRPNKASPWQHVSTKSVTQDRDSEALWSAAETDFSFFGDEDESNFPSLVPTRFATGLGAGEKEVVIGSGVHNSAPGGRSDRAEPRRYDTLALLSTFRKERKLAHQRHVAAAGGSEVSTEGYWDGVVQIVRPATGLRRDEELDYYGNRFEKGWLYR
ncbi:leucine Rich Repeat [Teratosphaeria destructans]|uniref:Leucine Rich Repeat n=1 Tax=Teratosphaeria destructans TaxID=418781 RepID=A0A9W7STA5_9PEZI|nr:leucine Rich Repeat [Teratosphaeria destructans]